MTKAILAERWSCRASKWAYLVEEVLLNLLGRLAAAGRVAAESRLGAVVIEALDGVVPVDVRASVGATGIVVTDTSLDAFLARKLAQSPDVSAQVSEIHATIHADRTLKITVRPTALWGLVPVVLSVGVDRLVINRERAELDLTLVEAPSPAILPWLRQILTWLAGGLLSGVLDQRVLSALAPGQVRFDGRRACVDLRESLDALYTRSLPGPLAGLHPIDLIGVRDLAFEPGRLTVQIEVGAAAAGLLAR